MSGNNIVQLNMEGIMNLIQIASEVTAFKGSFVEELFEALQNGWVVEDMEQAAEDEKIVGEMNELEKGLNFLRRKYNLAEKSLVGQLQSETEPLNPDDKARLIADLESCRDRFSAANNLLWDCIKCRLADVDSASSSGWGIRAGHKIVLMFKQHDHEALAGLLGLALLGSMKRG